MITLTDFSTIKPQITLSQEEALAKTAAAMGGAEVLVRRFGVKPKLISSRSFETIEVGPSEATILERNNFFNKRAQAHFATFYNDHTAAPAHVIHVTCTGYTAPSPIQWLINQRKWHGKTEVTHAYHMGCYASLPSIRIAEGLVNSGYSSLDIVHTEMCSLHFNSKNQSPEQIVVQSLFADGHAKYTVTSDDNQKGLRVLALQEELVENSLDDMTWTPGPLGMQMTLSREVPDKIASKIKPFILELLKKGHLDPVDVFRNGIFAIHPGGPKIIDSVQAYLELREDQIQASRKILKDCGNMSSATLPHIWKNIVEDRHLVGRTVVSLAFGPGLTIFGGVFKVV